MTSNAEDSHAWRQWRRELNAIVICSGAPVLALGALWLLELAGHRFSESTWLGFSWVALSMIAVGVILGLRHQRRRPRRTPRTAPVARGGRPR